MKRSITLLLMLSFTTTLFSFSTASGQSSGDPFAPGYKDFQMPDGAIKGQSAEAQNAKNSLSQADLDAYTQQLNSIITQVRQSNPPDDGPTERTLAFSDGISDSRQFAQSTRSVSPTFKFTFAAPPPAPVSSTCSQSIEQFVRAFYLALLIRPPFAGELTQSVETLAQAQAQGVFSDPPPLLVAARSFGSTLFHSPEYINRGRSDDDFVRDLFKAYKNQVPDTATVAYYSDLVRQQGRDYVEAAYFENSPEFENITYGFCNAATYDADQDGLPDLFENQVANAFTPYYHVSVGETDNFANFYNSVPQTVSQTLGRTPFSYFRVQPLGFGRSRTGTLFSFLRIDYLTLWDHDSGLVSGGVCFYNLFGLDDIVQSLFSHNLDNERSAALVAAPVQDYTYSTTPSSYYAYDYYTAAHEGTITDQSYYSTPAQVQLSDYRHIELGLTLSKHGTYTANVDGLPLTPYPIIAGTFAALYYQYIETGDALRYSILTALAYDAFYGCLTERFTDQGGVYANRYLNVGEPNHPINESGFIQDTALNNKLTTPLWTLQ